MFDERFAHYLSFGATDQETFRNLEGHYNGIVVPATIAVLQREGTGGFLLALSAATARTAYVIDPRSPLFQQPLPQLKRAHRDLAAVLEAETLASQVFVYPESFTEDRCRSMAERWVEYNETYRDSSGGKFEKYARRLQQEVHRPNAQGPERILAPYFVASSASDPWAEVSARLFQLSAHAARTLPVTPVIASENESSLPELAAMVESSDVVVWVSDFVERDMPIDRLIAYGRAIETLVAQGRRPFALYGSYFSVLLMKSGLTGFNHGVGFGDARNWRELPQSGPPLPRYYLLAAHRYVAPELAQQLFALDPTLVECLCAVCEGRPPLTLDYHALMQHSVLCREQEINSALNSTVERLADEMDEYLDVYSAAVDESGFAGSPFAKRALEQVQHLPRWSEALRHLHRGRSGT